ncbi:MAG: Gfo/Idh/MocA family oxidoreductase [Candidatus Aenigmatarchaeota archaeon]
MVLKTAVIGVGNMGKHHARLYSQLEESELIAVSDLDETAGKEIGENFNCKFYKDYKEMLRKEQIDVVSVVVPTMFHKDVSVACMNAGKHVLVEKPISDSIENATEMLDAAKRNDVKLAVGHIERFNPAVQKLKTLVKEGKLGEITSVMAKRVGLFPPQIKDANVIIDLASHDIDVFNYILEKEPKKIYASAGKALINKREDYAELFMRYNGTNAIIQVNWITPVKIRNLSVTGTKGYAELNYISQSLTLYESKYERKFGDFGDFVVKFGEPNKIDVPIKKDEPLKLELKSFLKSVETDQEPLVNGKVGLKTLEIALEAIRMARSE